MTQFLLLCSTTSVCKQWIFFTTTSIYLYSLLSLIKIRVQVCSSPFFPISGKMFQAPDLNLIVEFIFMFYKEKPIDWLLDHILWVKVCNPEKDAVSQYLLNTCLFNTSAVVCQDTTLHTSVQHTHTFSVLLLIFTCLSFSLCNVLSRNTVRGRSLVCAFVSGPLYSSTLVCIPPLLEKSRSSR